MTKVRQRASLPVDAVKATVKAYNEAIAAGKGKTLTPVTKSVRTSSPSSF